MSERCDWPRCRLLHESTIHDGNKIFHLCNKHSDMVQDEDDAYLRRARKKIGMAMPRKISGYVPASFSKESEARCAHKDCGYPVSLIIYTPTFPKETGGVPVCRNHWKETQDNDIKWSGVWERFIVCCGLDSAPLFYNVLQKGNTSVVSLVERLNAGAFDAPEC